MKSALGLATLLLLCLRISSAQSSVVEAALKPGGEFKPYSTRTLQDLPAASVTSIDSRLSSYGGLLTRKVKSTGFFYTTNLLGRWWLVDPAGCLFLNKGVCSVTMLRTPGAAAAWHQKFGSETNWAAITTALLRDHGFNGVGAWSDVEQLRGATSSLPYTRNWNFMSSYGKKRGGIFPQPGHTGYPGDCIFAFDPAFETFCDEHAKQLASGRNDPLLLGHFSDNELPFSRTALTNFLRLRDSDPGYQAAISFLRLRHGAGATATDITEEDAKDFLVLVVGRYCRIVAAAVKKQDPNHLFLGPRFHGAVPRLPEVFKAAGPYVDVCSVNLYHVWTPDLERLSMWERESGRPFMITEWYAKAIDSGLPNTGGAGWLVKTQRDRGLFYQNFTLALLQSPGCVGWHWFKYVDNDPAATNVDPSNVDSNKGMLSNRYEPYIPLLSSMKELNARAYSLAEYFSRTAQQK